MHDAALHLLFPYLQKPVPTLWFADESTAPLLQQLGSGLEHLHIVCNRYDIYQLAIERGIAAEYNDFISISYRQKPARILYRVSKEKSLVDYLLSLSTHYLSDGGELVLTGHKQDGIKGYHDKIVKRCRCKGNLKKMGVAYLGSYTQCQPQQGDCLSSDSYHHVQKIETRYIDAPFFTVSPVFLAGRKLIVAANYC